MGPGPPPVPSTASHSEREANKAVGGTDSSCLSWGPARERAWGCGGVCAASGDKETHEAAWARGAAAQSRRGAGLAAGIPAASAARGSCHAARPGCECREGETEPVPRPQSAPFAVSPQSSEAEKTPR